MTLDALIRAELEIWPPEPTPRPGRPGRGVPRRRRRRRVPWRLPGVGPLRPATRRAAVEQVGSIATSSATNDPSISSYDLGSTGSDKIVVVVCVVSGASPLVNSITIDGVTATIQENQATSWVRTAIAYRVMGSQTGTITISADTSGSSGAATIRAIRCNNVDQTTPITDSDGTNNGFASSTSLTLTSATGELCVDGLGVQGSTAWDEDTGQTEIGTPWTSSGSLEHTLHTSKETGAASVTMGWSVGAGSDSITYVAMALAEATGAAVPTISNAYGSRGSGQSGELIPGADNMTIAGTNFEASQGTGNVYLADSSTWATATKVAQTINTWSATSITTYGTNVGTLLGTSQSGTLYMFVENDSGEHNATAYEVYVAHRDVRVVGGVFNTPGSTGNFDVTHPALRDNKVKALVLWTSGNTSDDTDQAHYQNAIGFTDGTVSRCVEVYSDDGATIATAVNTHRERYTDRVLHISDPTDDSTMHVATWVSSITGGFRLNFTTATTANQRVHWIAFAGEDVQAEIESAAVSAGSISGVGFTPEFGVVISFCDTLGNPEGTFGTQTWGVFNDTIEQSYWSCYVGNGTSDHSSKSAVQHDGGAAAQVFQASTTWRMVVSSIDATGISWTGSNTDGVDVLFLHLAGVRTKIGQFAKSTGAAPASQSLPDFGFVPQSYGLVSAERTSESETQGDVMGAFGFYDGVNVHGTAIRDENDPGTTTDSSRWSSSTYVMTMIDGSDGSLVARATAEPIGNDQTPDIRWTTNNASAYLINVFGFEDPQDGNDKPPGAARMVT